MWFYKNCVSVGTAKECQEPIYNPTHTFVKYPQGNVIFCFSILAYDLYKPGEKLELLAIGPCFEKLLTSFEVGYDSRTNYYSITRTDKVRNKG